VTVDTRRDTDNAGLRDDRMAPEATTTAALVLAPDASSRNPMDAYLASLSPNGARAMRERLRAVARLIGVEAPPGLAPEETLRDHWHTLPFERVERIRQALLARGSATLDRQPHPRRPARHRPLRPPPRADHRR